MTFCATCQTEFSPENFLCQLPCKQKPAPRVCDNCHRVVKGHYKRHQNLPICRNYSNPNYQREQYEARLLANRDRRRKRARGLNAEVIANDNHDKADQADPDVDAGAPDNDGDMNGGADNDANNEIDDAGVDVGSAVGDDDADVEEEQLPKLPPPDDVVVMDEEEKDDPGYEFEPRSPEEPDGILGSREDEGQGRDDPERHPDGPAPAMPESPEVIEIGESPLIHGDDSPSSSPSSLGGSDSDYRSGDEARWKSSRRRQDTRDDVIFGEIRRRATRDVARRVAGLAPDEFFSLVQPLTVRPMEDQLDETKCNICREILTDKPLETHIELTPTDFAQNRWRVPDLPNISRCARPDPCSFVSHSQCLLAWHSTHISCPLCRYQVPGSQRPRSRCEACQGVFIEGDVFTNVRVTGCRHLLHFSAPWATADVRW